MDSSKFEYVLLLYLTELFVARVLQAYSDKLMSFIIQHAQTTTHQHVQRRNQSKDNTTNQREPTTHEQDTKTQAKKPVNHAALKIGYQPRNRLISQQQTTHHTQNTQKKCQQTTKPRVQIPSTFKNRKKNWNLNLNLLSLVTVMKKIPAWLILSAVFGALRWAVWYHTFAPTLTAVTTQVHLVVNRKQHAHSNMLLCDVCIRTMHNAR